MAKKNQKGAASFYIVIITSLLFGVIVVGFMGLVTREIKKSQENSLYQSSYDSALAGVEDAKLALNKYYDCVNTKGANAAVRDNGDSETTCEEILGFVEDDAAYADYCDVVSDILERNGTDQRGYANSAEREEKEVKIVEESENGETTTQAYTCVKLDLTPSDYRATLSANDTTTRVVPLQAAEDKVINQVKISWYATEDSDSYNSHNKDNDGVAFNALSDTEGGEPATPPTLSVQLYQTSDSFELSQFNETSGGQTNRGTVWLVPSLSNNRTGTTVIGADVLANSNNHDADVANNEGQIVECTENKEVEFACTATINLPEAIGGSIDAPRSMSAHTFMLIVSLPYNEPATDFRVEMVDAADPSTLVDFKNVQVVVDSTGRANDVYSRVEGRVEFNDIYFPYPMYALELGSGGNNGTALSKNFWVTENCWSSAEGSVTTCADSGSDD